MDHHLSASFFIFSVRLPTLLLLIITVVFTGENTAFPSIKHFNNNQSLGGVSSEMRLQGVAVKGRLLCGREPLIGAKVKIVDIDPRPDRDDLMGEVETDFRGQFFVSGATREVTDIEVALKIYHDCLDEAKPCQRRVKWFVPSKYYNNGTAPKTPGEPAISWFDIGTVNMELGFANEERDCRH